MTHSSTHDAFLNSALRLTLVGTIAVIALMSLILGYQALFDTFTGSWAAAGEKLLWGTLAAISALLLIYYRTDLIDT